MSEVQAGAAATGTPQASPSGANQVSSHSNSAAASQSQGQGGIPSHSPSGNQKSDGKNVGGPIKGTSTSGAPDLADQAAKAIEQGRELTQKDLQTPVTRVVNGQKVTKSLNEWINASQLEQASHQRFQQAQQLAKQAQQLIWIAQNNPAEFMRITGKDPNEFSQAQLAQFLEEQQMTEEQKELKRFRQEKQQREESEKQQKLEAEQKAKQEKDSGEFSQMAKDALEAWKDSGLPDDPYWGQKMAAEIARHQSQGFQLTWKEAAAIVKHDWTTSNQRILDSFQNVEQLANFLGEKVLKKLREYEVGRITSKQASKNSSPSRPGNSPASQNKSQPKSVTQSEYDAYWNKLGYGG